MSKAERDILVRYHGEKYKVVLGPPYYTEQRNGALMGTGMPMINLADPVTGELRRGVTVDIPEAPLKPGQVLVGGKEEGLRALTEAGVVRHTGDYYRSADYNATFAVCDLLISQDRSPGGGLAEPEFRYPWVATITEAGNGLYQPVMENVETGQVLKRGPAGTKDQAIEALTAGDVGERRASALENQLAAPAPAQAPRLVELLGARGDEMPSAAEQGELRREIAHDEALRREMWERGESVDRPTSLRSVLGYDLVEPSPAPEPGRGRGGR